MTDEPCTEINCTAQTHPASEGHIDGPGELERLRADFIDATDRLYAARRDAESAEAALTRVRDLVDSRDAERRGVAFGGKPFDALLTTSEVRAALDQPEVNNAARSEPVLTEKNPYPVCICVKCGPPWREKVPEWRGSTYGQWMALCPTCGNKGCPGAFDHTQHEGA